MATTSDELLAGVKRRVSVPSRQNLLDNSDILRFADNIISSRIVTIVESVNQEFFVRETDIPVVASQSVYSIPYRAVGRALRELKMEDSRGNVRNIALIQLEDSQLFTQSSLTLGFYFIGDKIRLVPDVPSNISVDQTLKVWYRMPPSRLVELTDAALVTGVSDDDVTVENVPTNLEVGSVIDFIQGQSGNSIYEIDQTITNINGLTISFGTDVVPDDLTAGDYISLAQTSPVVNFVPNECYSLMESLTAYRVLTAIGDYEGANMLKEDISTEEKNVKMILEPRIDGEPTIIVNRYGLVRGNKFAQRSWLYGQ